MCLEMMAFRILPPNFGADLYVWGSIISVFLTALTLGYFFGGMAADRRPHLAAMGLVVLFAGLLVPPIPRYEQPLAEWIRALLPHARWSALPYALLLLPAAARAPGRVVFRQDTMYHRITVEDTGPWRELKFDRSSQSGILRSDPLRSMYAYTDGFHLAPIYHPGLKHVLFIGGGAAT